MSDGWRSTRRPAARIRLPDDAVLALVRLGRTSAVVSLEVVDRGLSVLPLRQLETHRPGARRASRAALSRRLSRVPLVDLVGCEAEQLGHLLDDDGVHHRLQLVAAVGAVLDRAAEEHQSGGLLALAPHQRRQRHGVVAPVVGHHRRVLDGVLDEAEVSLPALVEGVTTSSTSWSNLCRARPQDGCAADRPGRRRGRACPDPGGRAYAAPGRRGRCRRRAMPCREPKRRACVRRVASAP